MLSFSCLAHCLLESRVKAPVVKGWNWDWLSALSLQQVRSHELVVQVLRTEKIKVSGLIKFSLRII